MARRSDVRRLEEGRIKGRGIRAARIKQKVRIIKRRLKAAKSIGIRDRGLERIPNKLNKTKKKFTSQHGSLKVFKQLSSRRNRRVARHSLRIGKDIPVDDRWSVRWDYW